MKKLLASLTLVALSSLALAQTTTVRIMTWEGADMNARILEAMKPFEQQNPTIKVEIVTVPSVGYDQTRNTMIASQQLPDLFWVGNDQLLEFARKGILFDWTSYANRQGSGLDLSKFAPGAIENYRLDGKLYGLPSLMNTYGYFYNADMFQAAGLPLPRPGWTWDQFFNAASKLTTKNGNQTTRYGVYGPLNDPFFLSQHAASLGGPMFQNRILDTDRVTVSPQMVTAARAWATAIQNGTVTPRNYPGDGLDKLFAAGQVPMLGAGQWLAKGFMDAKLPFKWGFAPLPIGTQRVTIYDAVGIAAPSYIKNPDAVWRVLVYLNTKAWETVLPATPVAPSAFVPSAQPYFEALKKGGAESVAASVEWMLTTPRKEGVRFLSSWSGRAWDLINARYNDILSGRTDAQRGLTDLANGINQIIQQNR